MAVKVLDVEFERTKQPTNEWNGMESLKLMLLLLFMLLPMLLLFGCRYCCC